MFVARPTRLAQAAGPCSTDPRPDQPASPSPRNKRPRLGEPGGVSEAAWRLLPAPRLSEVEKVWEWSPRPFTAFLIPKSAAWVQAAAPRAGTGAGAEPGSGAGRTSSASPRESHGPAFLSRGAAPGAPGGSAGPRRPGRDGPRPDTALRGTPRVPGPREGLLLTDGRGSRPAKPLRGVAGAEETGSREAKDSCDADGAAPSDRKENNISSSRPKIATFQSQSRLESAKPSYFRDSITITFPEFRADLNSNMSFVYLKEIAKRKNDKFVTYVRDFTNIYQSQNRPDVKKRKLQDDKEIVVVENVISDCFESKPQSLSNQNNFEGKKDVVSLHYYHHSRMKCDVRDSEKNFTLTPKNSNWKRAERSLKVSIPPRLEKSLRWNYNLRSALKRKGQRCLTMKNCKIICENMKKLSETMSLLQLLETDLLNKGDYHNTNVLNVHEQQAKPPMTGTLGTPSNLVNVVWFNSKGENSNMLQLKYYTLQKNISGNKKVRILTWYKMLRCEKQIDTQNVITSHVNATIKSGILSKYLQTNVLEYLNVILKISIAPLLSNFDSFLRNGHDWESEEEYIFKWIVLLNYSRNIVMESHIVYLARSLTFSRLFEDNVKHVSKKRKLFKIEQIFEGANNQNINLLTKSFLNFETYENVPALMDFDNTGEMTLTKESCYVITSCPEQLNVDNWTHYSCRTVKIQSGPQLTENNSGHINEKYYEISIYNQNLDTERKQKQKSHFNFGLIVEDIFTTLSNSNTMHNEQMNIMTIIQRLNFENLLGEIEGKIREATKSIRSCQVQKDFSIEKVDNSSPLIYGMCSMQSASVMNKEVNVEETKSADQNNGTDTKEYENILQASELANSKCFHPENDSTSYVNQHLENDSSEENNGCFQGLTANCLSTETLTIANNFEMKSKFDLVLEELRLFHEISKENETPRTAERNSRKDNYLGESNNVEETKIEIEKKSKLVENNKIHAPSFQWDMKAGPNKGKIHQVSFKWKTIPNNGEQEAPNEYCCPRRSEEDLFYSTPEEDCKKTLSKRPDFSADGCKGEKYSYLLKGGSHCSHGISRVQPLKTCNRPIRVGLSRKARLKHLHPYLK